MATWNLENGALAEVPCTFCYIGMSCAFPLRVSSSLSVRNPELTYELTHDGPKMAPRWPQDGPTWLQAGSKIAPR